MDTCRQPRDRKATPTEFTDEVRSARLELASLPRRRRIAAWSLLFGSCLLVWIAELLHSRLDPYTLRVVLLSLPFTAGLVMGFLTRNLFMIWLQTFAPMGLLLPLLDMQISPRPHPLVTVFLMLLLELSWYGLSGIIAFWIWDLPRKLGIRFATPDSPTRMNPVLWVTMAVFIGGFLVQLLRSGPRPLRPAPAASQLAAEAPEPPDER